MSDDQTARRDRHWRCPPIPATPMEDRLAHTTVVKREPATPVAPATPATPVTLVLPPMTPDVMVEKYIALRNKQAEIRKRHAEELARYKQVMDILEARLLDVLNQNRVEQMRAEAGTFYKHTSTAARVTRWSEALDFIRDNGLWELLEARVSKIAAEAIIEETKRPIPGVEVVRRTMVQVRVAS